MGQLPGLRPAHWGKGWEGRGGATAQPAPRPLGERLEEVGLLGEGPRLPSLHPAHQGRGWER